MVGKMEDVKMNLESYKESMIAGLMPAEEVEAEAEEMQAAKVGTIKPNCWEKIGEDLFIIYSL